VARPPGTISPSHHCASLQPGEALRIAKVYLLKWHGEGQLPYASLIKGAPHADAVVRRCQDWLAKNFREASAIAGVERVSGLVPRTLKRRFKTATGSTLIDYVQNLRVEEAKRRLEASQRSYHCWMSMGTPFFLGCKRRTGLRPSVQRMFQPIAY
jgi:transcriptional regulator GlxA family with amidase domain